MKRASFGARLIAITLDTFLLGIVASIVGTFIKVDLFSVKLLGLGFNVGTYFFVGLLYNWYFWTQKNGQTPGKKLMGIRVERVDGGAIRDLDAVVRFVGYHISGLILALGYLWALWDSKNETWHDKIAGTRVVRA